jgi:hypothetical protein
VAEYEWQRFRDKAIAYEQVAVTDAGCFHAYQYFALVGRVQRDFFDDGWLPGFIQHSSFRFHASASPYGC